MIPLCILRNYKVSQIKYERGPVQSSVQQEEQTQQKRKANYPVGGAIKELKAENDTLMETIDALENK